MQNKNIQFSYCCINEELSAKGITCNRTMRQKTFLEKGMDYCSQLAFKNINDLYKILEWNNKNNIKLFRITSELFPWASEYNIEDLKDWELIKYSLEKCGNFAKNNGIRLTFHPGPFNCLTSQNPKVIKNCIRDLEIHGKIFDYMGFERSHYNLINIHIGGSYGDRETAIKTWIENFDLLPESVKTRLTVENDDKETLYSTKMLYDNIYKELKVPIIFDSLHFKCGPQDSSYQESFFMAKETWDNKNIKQLCHHSNSRQFEDKNEKMSVHSDYFYEHFQNFGQPVDVDLECKMKEKALMKYLNDFYHLY